MKTLATILLLCISIASEAQERIVYVAESIYAQPAMHLFLAERIFIGGLFALVILLLAYRIDQEKYFGIPEVKLFIEK